MTGGNFTDSKTVDAEFIRDLFQPFGAVTVACSAGPVYSPMVTWFEHECRGPFEYSTKRGKRALMSYWRLPDRLYDDADELAQWARHALKAAHEVAAAKPSVGKKRMKTKR